MSISSDAYSALIARLETISGATVFHGRRPTIDSSEEMPAVCAYEGPQEVEESNSGFCDYLIRQRYVVECYVSDDTTPADSLRSLIESVQLAVESSTTLGGAPLSFEGIPAREMPPASGSMARAQIVYSIDYRRKHGAA